MNQIKHSLKISHPDVTGSELDLFLSRKNSAFEKSNEEEKKKSREDFEVQKRVSE